MVNLGKFYPCAILAQRGGGDVHNMSSEGKDVMSAHPERWIHDGENLYSATEDTEYFSISDLAREFNVTLRALRFYESKGLLKPKREGNLRLYSADDRTR